MKFIFFIVLLIVLTVCGYAVKNAEIVITCPSEGDVISKGVTFTAAIKNIPALVSVDWRLNGRSISGNLITPPAFSLPWHPAEVFDGPMTLQAIGCDAGGKVIATSAAVHFTVATGPGSIKLVAPADISKPLSGRVSFTVTAIRPLTPAERKEREDNPKFDKSQMNKTVECLQFFIDGAFMQRQFGAPTRTLELDTTRLPNGTHELQVSAYGWLKGVPPIGMLQTTFTTDNGHTPMAILPCWQELCLQTGNTAELAPRILFTDGKIEKLKVIPTYTSSNVEVASVDAAGRVTAIKKGVASVTLNLAANAVLPGADAKAKAFTAEVRVKTGLPEGLPHFSRNGRILLKYDPKNSVFVRSMFTLTPQYILANAGLVDLVKDAGINTGESGFFHNPNDGSKIDSLEKYINHWDPWFEANIAAPAKKLGLGMILSGDDWVRTTSELKWTATTAWAPDLAKHIWTKLRDSNTITSIEMMDEASFLGDGPAPTNGHWAKNDPAIHDKTLTNLIEAIQTVENHTPISWPVLGLAGPESAGKWMGDPRYADYASQYWTTMDWRAAYPWATSGPQMKSDLERVMVGRFPNMQWDKPQLMLVSGCGPYYTKRAAGNHYQPGLDEGIPSAVPTINISSQPLYAAISGAAGVRMYSVDFRWKTEREQAKIGTDGLQTGASPYGAGSDRWHAISAAYNLLARLEPYLLQPQINAVAFGSDFSIGARGGADNRLLMAINWSQEPRTVTVDLTPYQLPGVKKIIRYHVLGASSTTEILPTAKQDSVTFQPGEFIAWVVKTPAKKGDSVPPAVRLVMPYQPTVTGPITIVAEAKDDKKLKQVEFFVNSKSIGIKTKSPYEVKWDAITPFKGEWHGIKAIATDTAGNQSESRAIIKVIEAVK